MGIPAEPVNCIKSQGLLDGKFKGPDGTVFDIAGHPWMGAKGLEG